MREAHDRAIEAMLWFVYLGDGSCRSTRQEQIGIADCWAVALEEALDPLKREEADTLGGHRGERADQVAPASCHVHIAP